MNKLLKTTDRDLSWGWKAIILILGTVLFGILLNIVLVTVLASVYASQGFDQVQALEQAQLASGGLVVQVVMSVLQMGFMLWLVRWLVTKVEKQKFEWFKLGLVPAGRSKHIWLGVALAFALSLLTVGIGYFVGTLKYLGNGFELFTPIQVVTTLILGAILALASGFGEEVAFRGFLQSRIAKRYNPAIAILIVAVLFAFSHPVGNSNNPMLYLTTAILVGVLFGTVFVRTGSLWMGIALHTVWNFLQITILAVRNSTDERFFGAPLLVFDTVSGTTQMLIEFMVILAGLIVLILGASVEVKHRTVTNTK